MDVVGSRRASVPKLLEGVAGTDGGVEKMVGAGRISGLARDEKGRFVTPQSSSPSTASEPRGKKPVVVLQDCLRPMSPGRRNLERELGLEMSEDEYLDSDDYMSESDASVPTLRRAGSKRRLDVDDDAAVEAAEKVPRVGEAPKGRGKPAKGKATGQVGGRSRQQSDDPVGRCDVESPLDRIYTVGRGATEMNTVELETKVTSAVASLRRVVQISKNLKGTTIRDIKEATAFLEEATDALLQRNPDEEKEMLKASVRKYERQMKELSRDYACVRREVGDLKDEIYKLQERLAKKDTDTRVTPSSAPVGSIPEGRRCKTPLPAAVEAELKALRISTRFATEGTTCDEFRDLRGLPRVPAHLKAAMFPPLEEATQPAPVAPPAAKSTACVAVQTGSDEPPAAGTKKRAKPVKPKTGPAPAATTSAAPAPALSKSQRRRQKKKSLAAQRAKDAEGANAAPAPVRAVVAPAPLSEGWNVVVRRGAAKKAPQPQPVSRQPPAQRKPKASRLRAPRTSAVVLTLLPGAAEENLNYGGVLRKARTQMPVEEFGQLKPTFREAATGALIIELPDAQKADALATRFREAFGPEVLRVARPVKSTELRLHGLDPSITEEEVVSAVASAGGCDAAAVKCGLIKRSSRSGLGTAWVRCPTAAAKTIARDRLVIGWSAARVEVLRQRPRMCYRCLETGHVGACCKSEQDRSSLCYQCGVSGHKAADCNAPARCVVCAEQGRDADHRCGRVSCLGSKKRKPPRKAATQVRMDT